MKKKTQVVLMGSETREDVIDECINEVCTGRAINNFGHIPEARRALEWVTQDLLALKEK